MATGTTPGVRRRGPSKGDRTSQAILDTAEKLLAERDLGSITIDELASGAGISRSAFYFHFESREAVLYLLADRVLAELFESAEVWMSRRGAPPEDAVRTAIAGNLAIWRKHGAVLRAALRARDGDPAMERFWVDVARRFIGAAAQQIEADRAAGIALPGPPSAKQVASVLVSMNDEVFYHQSRARRSGDREVVDTLTTVWLRSIYGS
ncbi:MAG TPA: TetR/AcrR family transcriptional regulator [Kribbellaceae bacterium]|nr:TetR/AcrR family transcriptional regulator [Kribbellaceae bacterium]